MQRQWQAHKVIGWMGLVSLLVWLTLLMNGCGGGGTNTMQLNLYVPKPDEIATDPTTGETYVKGILLLYAKENVSSQAITELAKSIGGVVVGSIPQVHLYQVKIEGATADALRQIMQNLENNPLIDSAYLDTAIDIITPPEGEETPPPLEESRSRLVPPPGEWKFDNVDWESDGEPCRRLFSVCVPYRNWYLKMIRAKEAWDITRGSRTHSKIAIVDGGFDVHHEDLKDNISIASQLTLPNNSVDWLVHGTAVAGLAAAVGGNNKGVTGVCWFASLRLFGVGTTTSEVNGDKRTSLRSITLAGVVLAAESGARVINMSFSRKYSDSWQRFWRPAIQYAKSKDCLMVMAAGNDGKNLDLQDNRLLPQAFVEDPEFKDYILVVGAVDNERKRSVFSSSDPSNHASNYGSTVELYAPGGSIKVLMFTTLPGNSYGNAAVGKSLAGTSFAAPLVTGAAGLLLAVNPNLSAPELKRLLVDEAVVQGGIRILNVANAVRKAANQANIPIPVLTADQTVFEGAPATVKFDIRGSVVPSFITRIVLDFGDGTTLEIQPTEVPTKTVSHSYSSNGVYNAELRFYRGNKETPEASDKLTIYIGRSSAEIIIK